MAKKIIGYVELEWNCPNCAAKNPGSRQTCLACGAPQPKEAAFTLKADAPLLQDSAALEAARRAPDIHCPYCGTRNPADAKNCAHCGGDLVEGAKRLAGLVVAAQKKASVTCAACGAENSSDAARCLRCGAGLGLAGQIPTAGTAAPASAGNAAPTAAGKIPGAGFRPWMALPLIAFLLVCCVALGYFFLRTDSFSGVVQRVAWERTIEIESLQQVTRQTWRDQVPAGAETLACHSEVRSTQDQPAPGAQEVCGAPYTVDRGNGYAETVQDCVYKIYDDYCSYTALAWVVSDRAQARGEDLSPYWPQVAVNETTREGARGENYWVYFSTNKGEMEYQTSEAGLFGTFTPGSEWLLTVNGLGQIVDVVQP
ncbi:MAG: hypothetical protein Fur0035_06560 [Anaerolineales bacterium]